MTTPASPLLVLATIALSAASLPAQSRRSSTRAQWEYTLELPARARAVRPSIFEGSRTAAAYENVIPCKYICLLEVEIHRLARGQTFDQYMQQVVKPPADEPEPETFASSVVDSLRLAGRRVYVIDHFCGDCRRTALFIDGRRKVAEVVYETDDRESMAQMKRLGDIARTFRWR